MAMTLAATALPAGPGEPGHRFDDGRLTGFQVVRDGARPAGMLYLAFDTGTVMREWAWGTLQIGLAVMTVVLAAAFGLSSVLQAVKAKRVRSSISLRRIILFPPVD